MATKRKSAARRGKKKSEARIMPAWLRTILAVCIIAVFSAGFYWFFIRPYAYRWKPCYGQKGYGVCMPCDYEVHGIDISHYQGSIDWVQLTTNKTTKFPIHFVFMKATEGGDHADDTFPFNFDQAHRYGFIRGAYHFFSPKTDPLKSSSLSCPKVLSSIRFNERSNIGRTFSFRLIASITDENKNFGSMK